jgi:hypothetical protein
MKRGSTSIVNLKRGSTDIQKVYRGESLIWEKSVPFLLSGGVETTVGSDKVLTFETNGTLTVVGSGIIQILLVGGGKDGEDAVSGGSGYSGAGGAGGAVNYISSHSITAGSYNIVIGNFGTWPGTTTALGFNAGGGAGAAGGAGLAPNNSNGNLGTNGTTNTISGTSYVYASGGGGGAITGSTNQTGGAGGTGAGKGGDIFINPVSGRFNAQYYDRNDPVGRGSNYGAGGGGGSAKWNTGESAYGANGKAGVVIIRYTPT